MERDEEKTEGKWDQNGDYGEYQYKLHCEWKRNRAVAEGECGSWKVFILM